MEMILVDWTRMGLTFCVTGVVPEGREWKTLRPLPASAWTRKRGILNLWGILELLLTGPKSAKPLPRNVGWLPDKLTGLRRWDIVELMRPKAADVEPPHTEDLWVGALRATGSSASQEERYAILSATSVEGDQQPFGVPLVTTRTSAYLRPGAGDRSLVTTIVPSQDVSFLSSQRERAEGSEVRVRLPVPQVGTKLLPVKDHYLLFQAEQAAPGDQDRQAKILRQAVLQMGPTVAVRLGLSRGFDFGRVERRCWLMADGFFPAEEVEP